MQYHNNLLKLKNTHPQIHEEFLIGCFLLKRTTKSFSRLPIDLTLEQTINADTACQGKGILALTNSISERQRWAQSHFIRTNIISQLFEDLDLTVKENVSQDLKSNQISQNSTQLSILIEMIKLTMNLFSPDIEKSCLFNITSVIHYKKQGSSIISVKC